MRVVLGNQVLQGIPSPAIRAFIPCCPPCLASQCHRKYSGSSKAKVVPPFVFVIDEEIIPWSWSWSWYTILLNQV